MSDRAFAAPIMIHASAVAAPDRDAAALIRGPSGAGKSSFALRLIALGAHLVADDQTVLTPREDCVRLSAPGSLRGRIEARGVGLLRSPSVNAAPLTIVIDLIDPAQPQPRSPDLAFANFFGAMFPLLSMTEDERSAAVVYCLLGRGLRIDRDEDGA